MKKRLTVCAVLVVFLFALCMMKIYLEIISENYKRVNISQGTYTLKAASEEGMIYDCNFIPLVNQKRSYAAAVITGSDGIEEIIPYVKDKEAFYEKLKTNSVFTVGVTQNVFNSDDIIVFEVPQRYSDDSIAAHVVGYKSDGKGVAGIESAYDAYLRGCKKDLSVTFSIDGAGNILKGDTAEIKNEKVTAGVVTTIDASVQKICEQMSDKIKKGAVVVMEAGTGNILAMASFPEYNQNDIASSLDNEDGPLINRALSAYSVGSIFKLVTSASAYEEGLLESFYYNCTGNITVDGTDFHCHDFEGHGLQNASDALVNSCNPYFISLGQKLDSSKMLEFAKRAGFGREIILCGSINSSAGNLPSEDDLKSSGEMANFSFGQGILTASPLQIAQFTGSIANGGLMPAARLIKGYTDDGKEVKNEKSAITVQVMEEDTADCLKNMMKDVVYNNEKSKAKPENVIAAIKTSTAQTGQYDENGEEIYNAWTTGFFPFDDPEYIVTILIEDGKSGNDSAAPVFKEIADRISEIK